MHGLAGPEGPPGPAGPPGARGAPGNGQLIYRDATGRDVGPADRAISYAADHLDANGVRWPIDVETAAVISHSYGGAFFDGIDCTGNAYVWPVEAGFAFTASLPGQGFTYLVLPRGVAARQVQVASQWTGGECVADVREFPGVPLDDPFRPALRLAAPALTFVGPLHLEAQ